VWGELAVAAQANVDTFVYPNAAPQAADFNQSMQLWLGLEDYVLTYADTYDTRLSVFTAPVLAADDPQYRGVGVPRLFWKVAVWIAASDVTGEDRVLASTGYVLDQTPQLDDIDLSCGCPKPKLRSCDLLIFVEETAESVLAVDAVGVDLARLWEGA
jgi:endonuclease G, mitochondrial